MGSVQSQKKINTKGAKKVLSGKNWELSMVWKQNLDSNYRPLSELEETSSYSPIIPKISLNDDGSFKGEFCYEPESCETKNDHWSVENNLHWMLDVVFNEDQSGVFLKSGIKRSFGFFS